MPAHVPTPRPSSLIFLHVKAAPSSSLSRPCRPYHARCMQGHLQKLRCGRSFDPVRSRSSLTVPTQSRALRSSPYSRVHVHAAYLVLRLDSLLMFLELTLGLLAASTRQLRVVLLQGSHLVLTNAKIQLRLPSSLDRAVRHLCSLFYEMLAFALSLRSIRLGMSLRINFSTPDELGTTESYFANSAVAEVWPGRVRQERLRD